MLSVMQQKIYDYIAACIQRQGYPPSVREIGEAVGLRSPSTVHFHLKKLVDAGTGEIQFINVVPESLWSTIERAYSTGAYWDAYVTEALKQLGAENFAIQLQVQSIGGGYYRIYHNIYTE